MKRAGFLLQWLAILGWLAYAIAVWFFGYRETVLSALIILPAFIVGKILFRLGKGKETLTRIENEGKYDGKR